MSAIALLRENKSPSDEDIDLAMNGNICRCATYLRIRLVIHDAASPSISTSFAPKWRVTLAMDWVISLRAGTPKGQRRR
jgi:xanthine dehydrogenase iron-sulfur cluster and FAD-binding subunit A